MDCHKFVWHTVMKVPRCLNWWWGVDKKAKLLMHLVSQKAMKYSLQSTGFLVNVNVSSTCIVYTIMI